MKFIVTALVLHFVAQSQSTNITEDASANKTKRTVAGQYQNYGENRPVMLYSDNSGAHLAPQSLASLYAPVTLKPVFDPEIPKQVAAQQVLYEFQQTPTNAMSNVHVNQYYQPVQAKPENAPPPTTGPAQFIAGSESVATPVEHSALIRHGQNFAQVQYNPPQHIQTHQYIPGKYLYVNGKIIYQPNQQQPQQHQHGLHQQQQQHNYQPPRPTGFLYTHPQTATQRFMPQVPFVRPLRYRQFQPPQPNQFQPITKPMGVPAVNEEVNEEAEEENTSPKNEEAEEEEEESEDHDHEDEENDDGDRYFGKYHFDDDDEDHDRYREREEEDDEDNERGSSKPVPKKHQKKSAKPNKYNKSSNFKYSENYSTSSKFEKPVSKGKKSAKNPKMHYKAVKYTKEGSGKPTIEKIEAKQSQNIPVIHKQKIFKEKWYVTKSTDDSRN